MKPTKDTRWVTTPTRERLAATRKPALRRRTVMAARSVCGGCRSRVIEPRKDRNSCQGLPIGIRGGETAMHVIRRLDNGTQARCMEAGPESMSGARAHVGYPVKLGEPIQACVNNRTRMPPVYQRPRSLPAVHRERSETDAPAQDRTSEGNRSACDDVLGSLSAYVVAIESRETLAGGSL